MPTPDSAPHNHLLAALPAAELERLLPQSELVPMSLGEVLYKSGEPLQYVYFPTTSVVSLFYLLENGASAEIALVGNEGALGISQLIVDKIKPCRAVVQSAGHGYRLKVRRLQYELNRAGPVLRLLLHYAQTLSAQMKQTAVCNQHHPVEQQLCRWLLLSLDRFSSNTLSMTQDLITNTFGGHYERVIEAARNLQQAGLIHYGGDRIEVLNRPGLEQIACECYAIVKTGWDRLLADISRGDRCRNLGNSSPKIEG